MPFARITSFTTPRMDATGRVDLPWDKPGDALPLALDVETDDPARVKAEVWTNADDNAAPDTFHAVPMRPAGAGGGHARFTLDLPVNRVGNYRAVGRVSVDDGKSWQWMGQSGIGDVRFRPRDERFDDLAIEEVAVGNVNFDAQNKLPGTFADMMEAKGEYTLEGLVDRGVNALWIMPPFKVSKWDQRPAVDDAGSPYAVKDYFSIRSELSRDARAVIAKGGTEEQARTAALEEFKRFVSKAHELGVQVYLDVALNHVGHNYEFRDLFVERDAAGHEVREVRKDDFAQVVVSPEQLKVVDKRLQDPSVPDYMEYVAPWMYGNKDLDPHGARTADDKAPGGWWEWPDTAQLNHGRFRWGYHWWDGVPTDENKAVQGWLERILRFWAVDAGVDGFRLDHLTGLPEAMLEGAVNRVQADVDAHAPGKTLFFFGEDFHTNDKTRHFLDAGQGGWFHNLLGAHRPEDFEHIVEDPWFHDLLSLSSHDETRPLVCLGDNHQASARLEALLQLFGGPTSRVAGDDLGERTQIPFKQYRGVAALRAADTAGKKMAEVIARAGRARKTLPALHDDNRAWLRPQSGGADDALLAMARFPDARSSTAFVLANLSNTETRENVFRVDGLSIDDDKRYQVRDLMADDPNKALWPAPVLGRDLKARGLFAKLAPYEVQVLALEEA